MICYEFANQNWCVCSFYIKIYINSHWVCCGCSGHPEDCSLQLYCSFCCHHWTQFPLSHCVIWACLRFKLTCVCGNLVRAVDMNLNPTETCVRSLGSNSHKRDCFYLPPMSPPTNQSENSVKWHRLKIYEQTRSSDIGGSRRWFIPYTGSESWSPVYLCVILRVTSLPLYCSFSLLPFCGLLKKKVWANTTVAQVEISLTVYVV